MTYPVKIDGQTRSINGIKSHKEYIQKLKNKKSEPIFTNSTEAADKNWTAEEKAKPWTIGASPAIEREISGKYKGSVIISMPDGKDYEVKIDKIYDNSRDYYQDLDTKLQKQLKGAGWKNTTINREGPPFNKHENSLNGVKIYENMNVSWPMKLP